MIKKIIRHKTTREMFKFGIVGLIGTVVDLGIYNFFAIGLSMSIYIARIISFSTGATNNYFINRAWTFKSQEKKVGRQYFQFFGVSIIGLLINLGVMRLLELPIKNLVNGEILEKNIPAIAGIIVGFLWNYLANKFWTFKDTLKKD